MNRFDNTRPDNFRYQSTYIPLPLEEISDLAKDYSTRYKQGKALTTGIDLIANKIQAAPMDYELKNQFLKDANSKMESIVSKAKPEDWANPEFQDRMRNTLSEIAGDQRINTIKSNKKWFDDEYTKYKSDPKNAKDLDFSVEMDNSHPTGFKQNLQGKAFSGLNTTQYKESYDDTAKIMSNIPSNSKKGGVWDFTRTRVINNGETQVYNKTTNEYETVTPEQIAQVAKVSTPLFGRTDSGLYRIRKALAPIYGAQVQNLDYDTLHQMAESDPSGESMKRFNEVNDVLYDDLYRTGFKQAFKKTSYDQDISKETDRAAVDRNKKAREVDASFDTLGSIEGNIPTTPINDKDALVNLGINADLVDSKGNINYSIGDLSVNKLGMGTFKGVTKENQQKANDYYGSLVGAANNLGLDIKSYTDKGKINYDKLKEDLIDISKNLGKETGNSQELQAGLKRDLSKNYFGELTADGFKASPLVQKMKIYENNNPSTGEDIDEEDKVKIAENARFVGLDFNDSNLGSVSFTATKGKSNAEPKLYNGVLPDDRLKTLMKPIHRFTQDFKDASLGKVSSEMSKRNVTAASEALSSLATRIMNSKDPAGQEKVQRIMDLANGMNDTKSKVIVGHNVNGDKLLIGTVRYENNKPIKKVIEVDIKTGTVIDDIIDLGKIQNEESSVIQRMIAPGYNPSAKGYDNKEIDYEE